MPDITSPVELPVGIIEPRTKPVGDPSLQEEQFCEHFLATFSVKLASEAIGINPNTGSKWLKHNEKVKSYLEMRKDEIASHLGVTQDWIIQNWVEMVNRGMGRVDGFEVDHAVALKSSELLAKNLNMFTERVETRNVNVNISIEDEQIINRYLNGGGSYGGAVKRKAEAISAGAAREVRSEDCELGVGSWVGDGEDVDVVSDGDSAGNV